MEDVATGLLNIVAVPAAPKTAAVRPKKRNKYEKRRQKAKKARTLADNPATTAAANHRILVHASVPADDDSNHAKIDTTNGLVASKINVGDGIMSDTDEEPRDGPERQAGLPSVGPTSNVEPASAVAPSRPAAMAVAQSTSSPKDEQARAQYLAEFHARPRELDRRVGAITSPLEPGQDSLHLFDREKHQAWEQYGLHPRLVQALTTSFQLARPTTIQHRALSIAPDDDANLLIHSETGSGKTLAYLLPMVQSLVHTTTLASMDRGQLGTRAIILCPTRELATQTFGVLECLLRSTVHHIVAGCVTGDERRKSEKARLRKGVAVLVATPGRLLDHLTRTECVMLSLKKGVSWLVLDEADRLLDLGLGEQVTQIVQRLRAAGGGTTWRSVVVSATVPAAVEQLAQQTLKGRASTWHHIRAGDDQTRDVAITQGDSSRAQVITDLAESTPRQLTHYTLTVSAKLRLPALVAFLVERVQKAERIVIFMSTCASVDFYHAVFVAMDPIVDGSGSGRGMFGTTCTVLKLHGRVPHSERQHVLKRFGKSLQNGGITGTAPQSTILLATDVAARGINLPDCDWTVQYDPPSEVSDYIHRAGRVARAGKAGQSLLILLPSERPFVDVLKRRGVAKLPGVSLANTLQNGARACEMLRSDAAKHFGGGGASITPSRDAELFCHELQRRIELCLTSDEARHARTSDKGGKKSLSGAEPCLMVLAQNAYVAHIRSYPTKEKSLRHIFSVKALHYGHVARSFGLREPPNNFSKRTTLTSRATTHNPSMAFAPVDEAIENDANDV